MSGPSRGLSLGVAVVLGVVLSAAPHARADDARARALMREASAMAGPEGLRAGSGTDGADAVGRAATLYRSAAQVARDPRLREAAELNAAICEMNGPEGERAEARVRAIERSSRDPAIQGPARRALGALELHRGVGLMERETAEAIDRLTRAERWMRSAMAAERTAAKPVGDAESLAREIELTQRLIDALTRRLEAERQQDEQQQSEQGQQQGNEPQDGERGEDGAEQQQRNGNAASNDAEQPQGSSEEGSDGPPKDRNQGRDGQGGDVPKLPEGGEERPGQEPEQTGPSGGGAGQPSERKPETRQGPSEGPEPVNPTADGRTFNPVAAQILEKERRERAAIERLLRQMQGRPVRVERDW